MPIKDPIKRKEYQAKWQKDNPDRCKKAQYTYQENNPKKKLLKSSKYNAKVRGLEHSITEDDIIIPKVCPYLDVPLTFKVESCNYPTTVSLDRINSTKGYIPGNVQVISRLANLMKSYASEEQLVTFAKNVLKQYEISKTPS